MTYICNVIGVFLRASAGRGVGGGMMFDSLALHAGIHHALVYKMLVADIFLL